MSAMNDDELKRLIEKGGDDTRRHFDVVAERLHHDIQLVAEALTATREALNREAADIREEIRRTSNETQAMIKFSHRVDRLEGSTH